MVRWDHRLSGHEFEQTLGDNKGQGSLACCSPWGCKESDATELNWTEYEFHLNFLLILYLLYTHLEINFIACIFSKKSFLKSKQTFKSSLVMIIFPFISRLIDGIIDVIPLKSLYIILN